jgi:hypothetical protein
MTNSPTLPSLSLDALREAPEAEIVREVNEHLGQLNSSISEWRKPHHAIQAQLLIQELGGREQRKETKTMVKCTIVITTLTVFIAILTAIMAWVTVFSAK